MLNRGGSGVLLLRRCALLREVAPPDTELQKRGLICVETNAPKTCQSLYRICPYGVGPRLKPCLNRDADCIGGIGRFEFFEQQHAVHLNGFLA